ncbi:hypothetical protein BB561_001661 [Smittium simulii]|uniref:Histone deacetylase interacting domain-containing protein n=1 Tax=Smittium simulii TaxID=133385 RepID=A0A2T9YTM6_9FUNG|nr:hypothetical protein BB561_001661 [Smittium simulii]
MKRQETLETNTNQNISEAQTNSSLIKRDEDSISKRNSVPKLQPYNGPSSVLQSTSNPTLNFSENLPLYKTIHSSTHSNIHSQEHTSEIFSKNYIHNEVPQTSHSNNPSEYPPPTVLQQHQKYNPHFSESLPVDATTGSSKKHPYSQPHDLTTKRIKASAEYEQDGFSPTISNNSLQSNLSLKEKINSKPLLNNLTQIQPTYPPYSNTSLYRDSDYELKHENKNIKSSSLNSTTSSDWPRSNQPISIAPSKHLTHSARNSDYIPKDNSDALTYSAIEPKPLPSQPQFDQQHIHDSHITDIPSKDEDYSASGKQVNVRDALSYLDLVKFQFQKQPEIYNRFLGIMKDFKSNEIDTPGVIERVSTLFRGHPQLIRGFNTFLPPGYLIECSENPSEPVTVISPSSKHKIKRSSEISLSNADISEKTTFEDNFSSDQKYYKKHSNIKKSPKIIVASLPNVIKPVSMPTSQDLPARGIPQYNHEVPNSPYNSSDPKLVLYPSKQQPMEFNHAINFVNKIKLRFAHDTERYSEFLDILQTYQREAGPIQEIYEKMRILFAEASDLLVEFKKFLPEDNDFANQNRPIFDSRIHNVPRIDDQPVPTQESSEFDLVPWKLFNNGSSSVIKWPTDVCSFSKKINKFCNNQSQEIILNQPQSLHDNPNVSSNLSYKLNSSGNDCYNSYSTQVSGAQTQDIYTGNQILDSYQNNQVSKKKKSSINEISNAKKRSKALDEINYKGKDFISSYSNDLDSSEEYLFFEKAKKHIGKSSMYNEFIKLLNLYNQGILDEISLLEQTDPFIGSNTELYTWFKGFVSILSSQTNFNNQKDENIDFEAENLQPHLDTDSQLPSDTDIELAEVTQRSALETCKSYGPSYRLLPKKETQLNCSGRDVMCWEVLNDYWVSHPMWASEESEFVHHKKNQHEDALFRCEEDRHEMDINIETNLSLIRVLTSVLHQMDQMSEEEKKKFTLPIGLSGYSEALPRRALRKVYDPQRANEILGALHSHPYAAVPVVLKRLQQKDEEWRKQRREMLKAWREIDAKNFHKSLDHQSLAFKSNDRKVLSAKFFLSEIEDLRHEQLKTNNLNKPSNNQLKHCYQIEYNFNSPSIINNVIEILQVYIFKQSSYFFNNETNDIDKFFINFFGEFFGLLFCDDFTAIKNIYKKNIGSPNSQGSTSENENFQHSDNLKTESKVGKNLLNDISKVIKSTENDHEDNITEKNHKGCTVVTEKNEEDGNTMIISNQTHVLPSKKGHIEPTKLSQLSSILWLNNRINFNNKSNLPLSQNFGEKSSLDIHKNSNNQNKMNITIDQINLDYLNKSKTGSSAHSEIESNNTTALKVSNNVDSNDGCSNSSNLSILPCSRVFYCNSTYYVFIRLFQTLYSRLENIKGSAKNSQSSTKQLYTESPATKLNLRNIPSSLSEFDLATVDRYEASLKLVTKLISGQIDFNSYEDGIRYLLGSSAYLLLTVDKLLSSILKQLQALVADSKCTELMTLFKDCVVTNKSNLREYITYRTKAQQSVGTGEHIYRFDYITNPKIFTIQLLKQHDSTLDMNLSMEDKWAYYVDSYILFEPTEGVPKSHKNKFKLQDQVKKVDIQHQNKQKSEELQIQSSISDAGSNSEQFDNNTDSALKENSQKNKQSTNITKTKSETSLVGSPKIKTDSSIESRTLHKKRKDSLYSIQPYLSRNLVNIAKADEVEFVVRNHCNLEIKIPVNSYKLCFLTNSEDSYTNLSRRYEYYGKNMHKDQIETSKKLGVAKWNELLESCLKNNNVLETEKAEKV